MKLRFSVLSVLFSLSVFLFLESKVFANSQLEIRFLRGANGIITDAKTGLQWLEGPDRPISWNESLEWVSDLGEDWRMPTLQELETIYIDESVRLGSKGVTANGKVEGPYVLKLDNVFRCDYAYWIWANEYANDKKLAEFYYFNLGESGYFYKDQSTWCLRAFAVRIKK